MNRFEKTGVFHFVTESYLTDFRGRVPIPMLGNYLLHAASAHASQRGFGFGDMTERHTAWVLSRLAIEINRCPEMSEPVTLYTWIDDVGRLFTSRCFELTDRAGRPLVYARSVWAAIDMQTRRPVPLDVGALSAYTTGRPCPVDKPGKIAPVENDTAGIPYRVKYSDLDINGHLNSIKYMEHLLDLFDLSLFEEKEIRRFEIAYLSEGRYGMTLSLHRKETAPDTYGLAICCEGRAICRATADWQPAPPPQRPATAADTGDSPL
jgi:acyl-ACP thioesterase